MHSSFFAINSRVFRPLGITAFVLCWGLLSSPCAASDQPSPEPPASDEPSPEPPASAAAPVEPSEEPPRVPEPSASPEEIPPPPAGRGGIAVFPVVSTNLTEGQSEALGVLIVSALRQEKGGRIIAPDTTSQYSFALSDSKAAADYLSVEQYVTVEAVRLDRTTIVTATLFNRDGAVQGSAKMVAKSVDDFEHIAERLVAAVLTGSSVDKTRNLENITAEEAEGTNKTFVEKIYGFKTTLVVPYAAQTKVRTMVGASFDARLEAKSYFLEFGAGVLLPSSSAYESEEQLAYGGVVGEIGASYYLMHTDVSPYVGAGVMPRVLSASPANLAVYGQAGFMFFRTSSSRLYAELRVAQNVTPMETWEYSYDEVNDNDITRVTQHRPLEFGVNVGIGW